MTLQSQDWSVFRCMTNQRHLLLRRGIIASECIKTGDKI